MRWTKHIREIRQYDFTDKGIEVYSKYNVLLVLQMKQEENKLFKDILSRESVLISIPSSSSTEEQLYSAVYESIKNSEIKNIIWVCYQQTPDVVEKKLNLILLYLIESSLLI